MNGGIVLTHLAWYALSLACMRVRPSGFMYALLQDLTPELSADITALARQSKPYKGTKKAGAHGG